MHGKLFRTLAFLSVLALFGGAVSAQKGKPKDQDPLKPSEADLRDDLADRIRSDGGGAYSALEACVVVWVDETTGRFFLRSHGRIGCDNPDPDRTVVLDFSSPVPGSEPSECTVSPAWGQTGTLNVCGSNAVTDVRIIADKLFSNGWSTSPVTLPFSLVPDFRHTAFELSFEQNVPHNGNDSSRTLTAGSGAIAELYKYTGKGGNKISIGRFYMPFEITVTKLP